MKRLFPSYSKVLGNLFVLGVGALVTYLSYNALGRVFPDNYYYQILGLVVFDVAAIVWFLRIVNDSETALQYVWASIGFLAGFIGVVYMVRIETQLSAGVVSQSEIIVQLVDIFVYSAVAQFALTYAFKMSDKETTKRLHIGLFKADIFQDALRQAGNSVDKSTAVLGNMLQGEIMRGLLRDLHIAASDEQLNDLFGEDVVISENQEAQEGLFSQLKNALFGGKKEANEEKEEVENSPNEGGTK